ncbi:hypothetical protein Tco_0449399 [Tanacetum coccineum]
MDLQFEPHVLASRAKKAAKNHDPLVLIGNSNASSSHSHTNSSYSLQSYYVTNPPSVVDYDDEYQGELQGDSQEDKLNKQHIDVYSLEQFLKKDENTSGIILSVEFSEELKDLLPAEAEK